jgi:hypothetical protein
MILLQHAHGYLPQCVDYGTQETGQQSMATTKTTVTAPCVPGCSSNRIQPINSAPADFDPARDFPAGVLEFLATLHRALSARQRGLVARRANALAEARIGKLPNYLPPSVSTTNAWRIDLPDWCSDQRNQMTGPADEADLVVKMLNSGAPGVMLDLEDSTANTWEHNARGIKNILEALAGRLNYEDRKRSKTVSINPGSTVIFIRPRGLHLHQAGVLPSELLPAPLFDIAMIAYQLDFSAHSNIRCAFTFRNQNPQTKRYGGATFSR